MDMYDHLNKAAEHLRLAVALFPGTTRDKYIPAWAHYYTVMVRAMLKLETLNGRLNRPHMKRPHSSRSTP